jgi:ubiquinone/menaquinone biosynthesis C-methylase UbiE/pimeloyl-ACP methyl ester carboxylesterase
MLTRLDQVSAHDLDRLNRKTITDSFEIRRLLERLHDRKVVLKNGINRKNDPRTARIEMISDDQILLATENLDQRRAAQLFLNFEFEGSRFFFAATPADEKVDSRLRIEFPKAIYQVERRNLYRRVTDQENPRPVSVEIRPGEGEPLRGRVINWSDHGLGIQVAAEDIGSLPSRFTIKFLDGLRSGERATAKLRHSSHDTGGGNRWIQLGLSLSEIETRPLIQVDRRSRIIHKSPSVRARESAAFLSAAIRTAPDRLAWRSKRREEDQAFVPIEKYENDRGQEIRAIVDRWGDPEGATAVIIPPAWGRTKETLLPLAATIVDAFRTAGEPVIVIRFDGTNRRGESYRDPDCRTPGDEYLHFTFSQAARDISATIDFLDNSPVYDPSRIILATFSLAAIEGRHALALDEHKRVAGWVSAVGMVDLQSALRSISGGIDYAYGLMRGVHFGRHELVGVIADMDHTGLDAIAHKMVFLEDARREMAAIDVPVTWIHGRDDAWMDLDRVRDVLSCGRAVNRKLIEVPTGHQLRTSREALATFQLIAEEISEMAIGRRLKALLPPLAELARRNTAERDRRPTGKVDLRKFWRDYLLGRDRRFGMQLLTATAAYRNMMEAQVVSLGVESGQRIADLGAGTGEFSLHISRKHGRPMDVAIDEVDYVSEALQRSVGRHRDVGGSNGLSIRRVVANLDLSGSSSIPLRSGEYDAVLGSLVVSYLRDPSWFLREAYRILRPGGRIVISTLRRDADISKLFVDGVAELRETNQDGDFGNGTREDFDGLVRDFLNDASRILDLEEEGYFRFWDADEFAELAKAAGFTHLNTQLGLGDPPQAVVLSACRPNHDTQTKG